MVTLSGLLSFSGRSSVAQTDLHIAFLLGLLVNWLVTAFGVLSRRRIVGGRIAPDRRGGDHLGGAKAHAAIAECPRDSSPHRRIGLRRDWLCVRTGIPFGPIAFLDAEANPLLGSVPWVDSWLCGL